MKYTVNGMLKRQLSCDVTQKIRSLEGPDKDFHGGTGAGFQLRKRILFALLIPEITDMLNTIIESDEHTTEATSENNGRFEDSSIKGGLSAPHHNLVVRLRFNLPENKIVIVNFDYLLTI